MENRYKTQFNRLKANQFRLAEEGYKERISRLKRLKKCLENSHKQRLREAMYQDFKKPQLEVDFTDIYPVIDEINHAVKNLRFWLKNEIVGTPLLLFGSKSYIKYEPKGVCLIIAPWNFPITLTLGPLVSAIAAGNAVIIKPSEMTPNTSAVLQDIIDNIYKDNEVILIQGGAEVSKELLKLPFNHIFFTGSPAIGKKVMEAAAKNLTSVTLELGGKSPTIIDETVNLRRVAQKVAFGKFINAGQTCIAPDYLYVHESVKGEFIVTLRQVLLEFYGANPSESVSYSNVVSKKHKDRILELIVDAKEKGAKIYCEAEQIENSIAPTIVTNIKMEMKLMQEEIFGPLLPILFYKDLEEVIKQINNGEKPLAIYIYSKNKKKVNYLIENTRAGTTAINHNVIHFLNHNLPFGGSNNSGIGKAHGVYGFRAFSNARAILNQYWLSPSRLVIPPYNGFKQKIIDLVIKWF